jgi:penicillin-binding protein 1C
MGRKCKRGREAGLTGSQAAAPVLFDILDLLPLNNWFGKPAEEIKTIEVCAESGFKASPLCPKTTNMEVA